MRRQQTWGLAYKQVMACDGQVECGGAGVDEAEGLRRQGVREDQEGGLFDVDEGF